MGLLGIKSKVKELNAELTVELCCCLKYALSQGLESASETRLISEFLDSDVETSFDVPHNMVQRYAAVMDKVRLVLNNNIKKNPLLALVKSIVSILLD
jgi:hypothetical protein